MLIFRQTAFRQLEGQCDALPLFRCATVGLLACALTLGGCTKADQSPLPVQVGGYVDDDACLAVGKVEPGATGYAVRNRPAIDAPIVGTLSEGQFVWMCDSTEDQAWTGILFSHRPDGRISCGVSGTTIERRDYTGPCRQGWVPREAIRLFAG
ncbi:MAG: hypothetical protein AAF687_04350 [Pseudomonadota bacterium]